MTMLLDRHLTLDQEHLNHLVEAFRGQEEAFAMSNLEKRLEMLPPNNTHLLEQEFRHLLQELHERESLCKELIQLSLDLLSQTKGSLSVAKQNLAVLQNDNQRLKDELHTLKEDIENQREIDEKTCIAYEELERKVNHLEDIRVNMHEKFEQEKQQIRKTFIAQASSKPCQMEFDMLVEENKHFMKLLAEKQKHLKDLMVSAAKMEKTIDSQERQLENKNNVLEQLRNAIKQKDETIMSLMQQQQQRQEEIEAELQRRERAPSAEEPVEHDPRRLSEIFNVGNVNLEEELQSKIYNLDHSKIFSYTEKILQHRPYDEPINPESHTHSSHVQQEPARHQDPPKKIERMQIDPYYAHYVLTSQSVKIREDKDELLGVDMKPFYNEIIEKRIPMHLWDQWIKNKLKELCREFDE